jgi:general secretion pathway protein K
MTGRRRQRGIAIITALLLVVIIAAIATTIMIGQHMWLRQAQNLKDLSQAEVLRVGAMEYAAIIVTRDVRDEKTQKTDTLAETWAQPIPRLPVEDGYIEIEIKDAQARFNLNNVVQGGMVVPQQKRVYERLLLVNKVNPALTDALVDWLDADSGTQVGGAEDLDYLNFNPPYRAANRALTSIDELRLIKGYTEEIVDTLRPYLIALPPQVQSSINVNTAEAPVLAALTGINMGEAEALVAARVKSPFTEPSQFLAQLPPGTTIESGYDIKSSYFIVSVAVHVGRAQRDTEGLIERPGGPLPTRVLWHRLPPMKIIFEDDEKDET